MGLATTVFVAIDKLFDGQQNKRKCTAYKGVDFVVEKDIRYGKDGACLLDTYHVKNDGSKYPVMLYIHGGGFVAGDKHHRRGHSRWIANMGYFVVNINYALSPEYKFPTMLKHLVQALNWVGDNAEKYNLDLDRMVVSGDSAGGYSAAMLACICTNKALQDRIGVSTGLKFGGAVLNCGIYDVGAALQANTPFDLGGKILKDMTGIAKKDFATYEYKDICAPIDYVTSSFPKTFVTYAKKDFFCGGQGERMIEKLKELGVYHEEYHSTKFTSNHCFSLGWKGKDPEANNRLTESFLIKFKNGEI